MILRRSHRGRLSGSDLKEVFNPSLLCPLCALRPALVDDKGKRYCKREHIPPKAIFVKKDNLFTVPSCDVCNAGTSTSDEKFKVQLGLYLGENSPLWPSTLKTFHHPDKKKYKESTLSNISSILVRANVTGGWGHKILVEAEPIKTVIKKVIRGLYWQQTQEILPAHIDVDVGLIKQGEDLSAELQRKLNQYGEYISSGDGAFEVQYLVFDNYVSIWKLRFYNQDCFFCYTEHDNS